MHVPCYLNRVFADTCNYGDDRLQHFCPYFDLWTSELFCTKWQMKACERVVNTNISLVERYCVL